MAERWERRLISEVFRKAGQHMIQIGRTGSGKTQGLYYLLDGLAAHGRDNTIAWIDTGKSSEFLALAQFKPLQILLPLGCEIDYTPSEQALAEGLDIKITSLTSIADVWHSLDKDRINVICFSRFVRGHIPHAILVSQIFRELIDSAYDYKIHVPLDIFVDEFQFICPARHLAKSRAHYNAGMDVIDSLWTMRSLGVRFIVAVQSWKVINVASRDTFDWIMVRRGAEFTESGKLRNFNLLWSKTPTDCCYIVYPDRNFSEARIHLPFYGDGKDLGQVRYKGQLSVDKAADES